MSTENNLGQYDATLLDKNNGVNDAALPASDDGNGWKKVVMGGSAGILLGAVGTLLTSATAHGAQSDSAEESAEETTEESATEEETTTTATTSSHPYVDGAVPVADGVSDDMSFSQAFAAARAEVGTAGAFEWRGNVYSTFTAEEWDAMSAAERADYGSHFSWAGHTTTHTAQHTVVTDDNVAADATAEVQTTAQDDVAATAEHTPSVEVLGVVHDYETGMNIAGVVVDGEPIALFDANGDGIINVGVADLNHDGEIQENEMANLSDQGITVDDLGGITSYYGDPYADNDDIAPDDGLYEA